MKNAPAVKVEGIGKVIRMLKAIDPALVDELKTANRSLGELVAGTARDLVPKRSGTLAGSIRPAGTARTGIVRAGRRAVPYAGPIHFGWRRRNIEPRPFLYDALDERRTEVYERYLAAIVDVTNRVS